MEAARISPAKVMLRILAAIGLTLICSASGGILESIRIQVVGWGEDASQWLQSLLGTHTAMLVSAVLLSLLLSKGKLSRYGFRRPTSFPLLRPVLLVCGISAVSSLIGSLLPGKDLPFEMDFLQEVVLIWIWASVAEETVMRGLVQSYLSPLKHLGLNLGGTRLSLPVLVAAILFGLIHLGLLTFDVAPAKVLTIVIFAMLVGVVAGYYRERTESLVPAILVHALANVTGSVIELLFGS
jgi:membrane protease YdiL (CAAX protease family)